MYGCMCMSSPQSPPLSFPIHSAMQGCAEHAVLCAEVRMHAFFLPNFLPHSLNHNYSQSELDKWLEVLNRAIYGPRGGGMFGNELRVQVRREVRVLVTGHQVCHHTCIVVVFLLTGRRTRRTSADCCGKVCCTVIPS
jgi:hypothetical protein